MKNLLIITVVMLMTGCANRNEINFQTGILDELDGIIEETEMVLDELDDVSDEFFEEDFANQSFDELDSVLEQLEDVFILDEVNDRELIP